MYIHAYIKLYTIITIPLNLTILDQVLSESLLKALLLVVGQEARESARFVHIFDKFSDVINVRNFTDRKFHRIPFQNPYCNGDDICVKVYTTQ